MVPVVLEAFLQVILMLATGDVINPDKLPELGTVAVVEIINELLAMTVDPSHSLQSICDTPAESTAVIVPEANHVPDVPCAILGPST